MFGNESLKEKRTRGQAAGLSIGVSESFPPFCPGSMIGLNVETKNLADKVGEPGPMVCLAMGNNFTRGLESLCAD